MGLNAAAQDQIFSELLEARGIPPGLFVGSAETVAEEEDPDHWHRRLLRARGKRPRRRRAGEERDELASAHSITSSARPDSGSGTVMPSALAVLRFRNSSTLVDC